jgi:hypothetical protein
VSVARNFSRDYFLQPCFWSPLRKFLAGPHAWETYPTSSGAVTVSSRSSNERIGGVEAGRGEPAVA